MSTTETPRDLAAASSDTQPSSAADLPSSTAAHTPRRSEHSSKKRKHSVEKNAFKNWDVDPSKYALKAVVGHGSYGEVAEAIRLEDNRKVAIKRINGVYDLEVDTRRILREVFILANVKCEFVISLMEVLKPSTAKQNDMYNEIYLVFEHMETDLHKLIQTPQYLSEAHVQFFLYQLLCAVKHIHTASVVHRDIKPANILLNEDCALKLCDFGLARVLFGSAKSEMKNVVTPSKSAKKPSLTRSLTKHVVTRWYRPPELILLQEYNTSVDVWSCGCILAELLSMQKGSVPKFSDRQPLFPGRSCFPLSAETDKTYKDSLDQLNVIFDVIGTPSPDDVAELGEVKHYLKGLAKKKPVDLSKRYPAASENAIDLLKGLLTFNPSKRLTIEQAIAHPFLSSVRERKKESSSEINLREHSSVLGTTGADGLKKALELEMEKFRS